MISYCTSDHKELFDTLNRYFKYNLGNSHQIVAQEEIDCNNLYRIFIFDDERNNQKFLKLLEPCLKYTVLKIGYNKNCTLNLLDFQNLHDNIEKILAPGYVPNTPLFTREELIFKVQNFFKGHGEESLISGLNWTRYYLGNGPILFKQNEITHDEYINIFLSPGLSYWQSFNNRYTKYNIYLRLLGYTNEVEEVKQLVSQFGDFLIELSKFSDSGLKLLGEKFISENIVLLKKIDEIMNAISRDLDIGDFQVQNFSS